MAWGALGLTFLLDIINDLRHKNIMRKMGLFVGNKQLASHLDMPIEGDDPL